MVSLNTSTRTATVADRTYNGAPAIPITPYRQLLRLVMACMLWEDQFYINGEGTSDLIRAAVKKVSGQEAREVAVYARHKAQLRHVPLLIVREMARNAHQKAFVSSALAEVIARPDELAEFLLIYDEKYARDNGGKGEPLSAQVKKGLAAAFAKFDEYQLAKYDKADARVRLRDVLFFSHAKPKDGVRGFNRKRRADILAGRVPKRQQRKLGAGSQLFAKLVHNKLESADTWSNRLSAGEDKKESFVELMEAGKMGGLALLRNLRKMIEVGVTREQIAAGLKTASFKRVLPFRFIAAARVMPQLEDLIEPVMLNALDGMERLPGKTALLVDVSQSMDAKLSGQSELTRMDAACGLAILARELCEVGSVLTFSNAVARVPPRRGFALRDAIMGSQQHSGTMTGLAIQTANIDGYDRIILITDEQSTDRYPVPVSSKAYVINVGAYQHGLGYRQWVHVDGFSEATLKFIAALEAANLTD